MSKIPPLKGPASTAVTDNEKAEALADSLSKQFRDNDITHQPTEQMVENTLQAYSQLGHSNNLEPARPSEILYYIKELKLKKSPGKEGITNKMVAELPLKMIFKLTQIINSILKLEHFPTKWKLAAIVPIPKPEKPKDNPESYRPISLLSTLSKITEKVIYRRLNTHLDDNKIIIPQQMGFRRNLSTTHQLYRVVDTIANGFSKGAHTAAIFLDIQKAFDRVWLKALIHKQVTLGLPHSLINILISYLFGRSFVVRVNNTYSTPRLIQAGVPQGSILGPILFNLYVNDIPQTEITTTSLFADDTALLATHRNPRAARHALTYHLQAIETWLVQWKIKVNVEKTVAVYFSHSKKTPPPPVTLYDVTIPWSKETKYLGVILDSKLTFAPHITCISKKFRESKRKLFPLIARNSTLNRENKILVYSSFLRPVISYACPVWVHAAKTHIDKLCKLQNVTIRQIVKAKWFMRNRDIYPALKFPVLMEFLIKLTTTFFNKLENCENAAIRSLEPHVPNEPKHNKRPRAILYR